MAEFDGHSPGRLNSSSSLQSGAEATCAQRSAGITWTMPSVCAGVAQGARFPQALAIAQTMKDFDEKRVFQDIYKPRHKIEVAAPVAVTSMHVRKSARLTLTNLKAGRACLAATGRQAETKVALIRHVARRVGDDRRGAIRFETAR
jgi:hypothetical protein